MADGLVLVARFLHERFRDCPVTEDPAEMREFLDELERGDHASFRSVATEMIDSFAIWFPSEAYASLPVLLPHVLRDNACRKQQCALGHAKRSKGRVGEPRDLWSTPSSEGYLRDDNSLIKNLVDSIRIESQLAALHEQALGKNFVACHVWPMATARHPWLNSFVPNLVWLPKPLDVFSDREGHFVQMLLRGRARSLFGSSSRTSNPVAIRLWNELPDAQERSQRFSRTLNTFQLTGSWTAKRLAKIRRMASVLEACASGRVVSTTGHSHYDLHVHELSRSLVSPLARSMSEYAATL